jgi:hypothetical protein
MKMDADAEDEFEEATYSAVHFDRRDVLKLI